jgi:peroxin-5
VEKEQVHLQPPNNQNELARTAGMLLENIKHEQNPKFQKSQFMGLMKQLRDGDIVVEGNKMVESEGQISSQVDKGKGRALDTASRPLTSNLNGHPPISSTFIQDQQAINQSQPKTEEDHNDAYFRQENADFSRYWNETQPPRGFVDTAETLAWDKLQADWDNFEATSSGIKAISHYQFQGNNPYLLGESSTRHHLPHTHGRQLVLEVCQVETPSPQHPESLTFIYFHSIECPHTRGYRSTKYERRHSVV